MFDRMNVEEAAEEVKQEEIPEPAAAPDSSES
jgi:hypothetical protein